MEDPKQKFSTGTQMSMQGRDLLTKDGGAREKSHVTSQSSKVLKVSAYDPLLPRIRSSEHESNTTVNCQYGDHLDALSELDLQGQRISAIQDGEFLSPSPSACTTVSDFISVKFDTPVSEYDDKKVDEWLKTRADSLSNIVLEMKNSSDDYLCGIEIDRLSEAPSEKDGNPTVDLISATYSTNDSVYVELDGHTTENENHNDCLVNGDITEVNVIVPGEEVNSNPRHSALASLPVDHSSLVINVDNVQNSLELQKDCHLNQTDIEESVKAIENLPASTFRSAGGTCLLSLQELEHLPKTGMTLEFEADLESNKTKELQENSSHTDALPIDKPTEIEKSEVTIENVASLKELESSSPSNPVNGGESTSGTKSEMSSFSLIPNKETNTIQIVINDHNGNTTEAALQQSLQSILANTSLVKVMMTLQTTIHGVISGQSINGTQEDNSQSKVDTALLETNAGIDVDNPNAEEKVWLTPEDALLCPFEKCKRIYTASESKKYKMHILSHSTERLFKCTEQGCQWAFPTENRLKRHMESHFGRKDFICEVDGCNKRFTTIYNLKTHKNLHQRACSIVCPSETCTMTFATKRQMQLHLREHQEVPAPYKCPVAGCGKECYSSNSLSSHLRVHKHSEDDLKCPFVGCEKIFNKVCRLKEHVRQHTGERPYVCSFEGCHWSFISASKLTRHMRKHTGERKFPCPEPGCGKAFLRPEHLKGHIVVHSGGRPFKCPHEDCDSSFTAKSSLYIHLKKHKNAQKLVYPCPVESCDKTYSCKTSLRMHLKKFHLACLDRDSNFVTLVSDQEFQEINASQEIASLPVVSESALNTIIAASGSSVVGEQLVLPEAYVSEGGLSTLTEEYQQNGSAQLLVAPELNTYKDTEELPAMTITSESVETSESEASQQDSGVTLTTDDLELLMSPHLLQQNNSGSARTDYCSNYILSSRAKRRRLLRLQQKAKLNISIKDTTSGIQLVAASPFQDDSPMLSGEMYQDEVLGTIQNSRMAPELPTSTSLLSEADPSPLESASDFGSTSVNGFLTSIGLRDLE